MRKITNLLTLLLLAVCSIGASAETVTLDGISNSGGTFWRNGAAVTSGNSWSAKWVSSSELTFPEITIQATANNMHSYRSEGFVWAMGSGNSSTTYTMSIADGYVITGLEAQFYNGAAIDVTMSLNGESATSTGNTTSDAVTLAVSGLSSQTISIGLSQSSGTNTSLVIPVLKVTYEVNPNVYNYTYTQYDGSTYTVLGTGSGTAYGDETGYQLTAPEVDGYVFLGAADISNPTALLDLSGNITATNIALLYSPIVQSLSATSQNSAYIMSTPRGFIHATSADDTQFTRTMAANGSADPTNPLHQWTFVQLDGNYYLYNVGTKKFASASASGGHDLVTSAPKALTEHASTYKAGYPLVFSIDIDGSTYYLNMNNAVGTMFDTWSEHDDGNTYQIVQVPTITVTPEVYVVNFTNTAGDLTSVFVDGTEVELGTDVIITSGATVSNTAAVNAIESYNGHATLAEALAADDFEGTINVALAEQTATVTLNVSNGSRIVKTVVLENVPANTELVPADILQTESASSYYINGIYPKTVTTSGEDETIEVTYESTLPFELSEDPESPDATTYLMTLRAFYAHGIDANSTTTFDLDDQTYYWAFGGNEFDGITVYNKGNGYLNVGSESDDSKGTFSATPTAFQAKPNSNETNGFNLNIPGTNAYINNRDSKVSTWLSTNANGEVGSCLVAYSISEAVAKLIDNDITPYFNYAGCVNSISYADALSVYDDYVALVEAPNYEDYKTLKATIEALDMVQPSESYVMVVNAYNGFYNQQGVFKAMYYDTEAGKIRWKNMEQSAPFILKLHEGDAGKFSLSSAYADQYLQTKNGAVTSDAESALTFEVIPSGAGKVALAYNPEGGTDAALHAEGHASGAGISGNLVGWTKDAEVSLWHVMPVELDEITLIAPEGVADGEQIVQGFANSYDAQLPLTVGVYTINSENDEVAYVDTVANGQVVGGEGYIISGKKGQVVPLLPVTEPVAAPENNLLVVGDGSEVNGGFILAYKKGEDQGKFWTIIGLTIPEDRSYLPEGTSTAGLESIFGGLGEGDLNDVTGINAVSTDSNNAAIYDLQGRRVNKAQKGLYIIGGKKVMK